MLYMGRWCRRALLCRGEVVPACHQVLVRRDGRTLPTGRRAAAVRGLRHHGHRVEAAAAAAADASARRLRRCRWWSCLATHSGGAIERAPSIVGAAALRVSRASGRCGGGGWLRVWGCGRMGVGGRPPLLPMRVERAAGLPPRGHAAAVSRPAHRAATPREPLPGPPAPRRRWRRRALRDRLRAACKGEPLAWARGSRPRIRPLRCPEGQCRRSPRAPRRGRALSRARGRPRMPWTRRGATRTRSCCPLCCE
jgi:hypothetical protein